MVVGVPQRDNARRHFILLVQDSQEWNGEEEHSPSCRTEDRGHRRWSCLITYDWSSSCFSLAVDVIRCCCCWCFRFFITIRKVFFFFLPCRIRGQRDPGDTYSSCRCRDWLFMPLGVSSIGWFQDDQCRQHDKIRINWYKDKSSLLF